MYVFLQKTIISCCCIELIIFISYTLIIAALSVNTPQPLVPYTNQNLTDVAIHFLFYGCDNCTKYQFQLSQSIEFPTNNLINITTPPDDQSSTPPALWTSRRGINSYFPPLFGNNQLPKPGIWYWRLKGFVNITWESSNWSQPVKIYINNNHEPSNIDVVHGINIKSPLFQFELWRLPEQDVINFNNKFPPDLLDYIAVSYSSRSDNNKTLLHNYLLPAIKGNMPILISSEAGPHIVSIWESLAEIEYIFQTYNNNNIYGIQVGEKFWNFYWYQADVQLISQSYAKALMILCSKYGKYYIWGDGEHDYYSWQMLSSDPNWIPFLQKYSKHLIFLPKSNILPHFYPTYSATLGLWLSNYTSNFGYWNECWYWQEAGFTSLGIWNGPHNGSFNMMPWSFFAQQWILGVIGGGTVFVANGQPCVIEQNNEFQPQFVSTALYNYNGSFSDVWYNFVKPFMYAVINENLIPSIQEVQDMIHLNIEQINITNGSKHRDGWDANQTNVGMYQQLYNSTYHYRDDIIMCLLSEIIPNTARYYMIPISPIGINLSFVDENIYLNDSRLQTYNSSKQIVDALYPNFNYDQSDGFVQIINDKFYVMTTYENSNITQNYNVKIGGFVFYGNVEIWQYFIGRFEDDIKRAFIQTQSSFNRTVSFYVKFNDNKIQNITCNPTNSLIQTKWIQNKNQTQIIIQHFVPNTIDLSIFW